MKKIVLVLSVILALGVAYWLISPLFINEKVNESLDEIKAEKLPEEAEEGNSVVNHGIVILKTGILKGEAGHRASGDVSLVKTGERLFIRFEDNFDSINGPDLFVHLGKDGKYDSEANLGALKGNIGGQNYEIPGELNIDDYDEVWVWCRAFTVPFASVQLE